MLATQVSDRPRAQPKVVRPGEGECLEAFGDRVWLVLTTRDTDGQLVLIVTETPAGSGPPLHVHAWEDELAIVQSGHYEFEVGVSRIAAGPGTVVYCPREIPHTFCVVGDEPGRLFTCLRPGGFDDFFRRSAKEFSTGAPDIRQVFRIGAEHGITFLTPECAAYHLGQLEGGSGARGKVVRPEEGEVMAMGGNRARIILTEHDTRGHCGLIELEAPPGFGPALHAHSQEDELFLVQSGRYEFHLGSDVFEAGPGTVIYAARPVLHSFHVISDEPGRMLILFHPSAFEEFSGP